MYFLLEVDVVELVIYKNGIEIKKFENQITASTDPIILAKEIIPKLHAFQELCEKAGMMGIDDRNELQALKLKAEKRLGELLGELERGKGNQYAKVEPDTVSGSTYQTTLTQCGINEREARRLQELAVITNDEIDEAKKEANRVNQKLTKKATIEKARKKKAVEKRNDELVSSPLPKNKYSVIYADPPWPVSDSRWDKWESSIDEKYPTMELSEIEKLPILELADENCSLFLWTTQTFLHDALNIIEKWGFKYHLCITWAKKGGFTNFGFFRNTEFLLFAYCGKILIKQDGKAFPAIYEESKKEHSRKPDFFREMIKEKTTGKRIELFARGEYQGFDVWGNEID